MATYGELANRIARELPRSDVSITDLAQTHIQSAIRFYEGERFTFNEGKTSFTASNGSSYYNLPVDFLNADAVTAIVNGTRYDISPQTFQQLEWMDLGTETADPPCHYAIFAQQMRLYPKPQTTRQVDVFYQKKLTTLTASTDTNAWTTEAEDLIYAHAKKTIQGLVFKDFEGAMASERFEGDVLQVLKAKAGDYQKGVRLRAHE